MSLPASEASPRVQWPRSAPGRRYVWHHARWNLRDVSTVTGREGPPLRAHSPHSKPDPEARSQPAEICRLASRANLTVSAANNKPAEPAKGERSLLQETSTPQPPKGRGDSFSDRQRHRAAPPGNQVAATVADLLVDPDAWDLVHSFHARLGRDVASFTASGQRQELRAAHRLLARGASPSEASRFIDYVLGTPKRWAPPTLRLYDRAGRLARTSLPRGRWRDLKRSEHVPARPVARSTSADR
jgi:hypothetical protein